MRYSPYFLIISLLFIISFFACNSSKTTNNEGVYPDFELFYETEQFTIFEKEDQFLLEVKQAYKGSSESERYLLYPAESNFDSISGITHFIPYPVYSVAISSTTHLGYLEALGMQDQITAASNLSLYYSEDFNNQIDSAEVVNLGGAEIDEEKLIQLNPNVFFTFALSSSAYASLEKLRLSGNKVVIINEYLEADPLQKASWLKFFACFFGKDKLNKAEEFLGSIESQYLDIKSIVENSASKPKVMMGFPWKGSWYVSGGRSYQANFFHDAGADYIWQDHQEEGGVPLDLELAINDALEADIWINPGNKTTMQQILDSDSRYKELSLMETNMIYSNYKRSNSIGANDYWERGVVRPDLILKDLGSIFHPELIKDHELFFYKRLDAE